MQEYVDGSFGEIKQAENFKQLFDNPDELAKTRAIHFGTNEELQDMKEADHAYAEVVAKQARIEEKINRIIIHLGLQKKGEILIAEAIPNEASNEKG